MRSRSSHGRRSGPAPVAQRAVCVSRGAGQASPNASFVARDHGGAMSYRLSLTTPPQQAVQRAATVRLGHAIDALGNAGPDERDAAVHTARKDVKKTRALLRLHRSGL